MEAEATMICVDNSRHMIKPLFLEQADAIKYYFTEKLNATPMNVVAIASMADRYLSIATYPTRDLKIIMLGVRLPRGGKLLLVDALIDAERVWCTDLNKDLQKRIVVFAGGSQIIPTRVGESCSPPPDIKDKEYYSRIPYDMIAKWIEYVFQYADCINAAHEAAAITEAD
nr:hypothetical protein [Tanacetum cinerariifolium]